MEKEITVVSAFFNINRQAWKKFERLKTSTLNILKGGQN